MWEVGAIVQTISEQSRRVPEQNWRIWKPEYGDERARRERRGAVVFRVKRHDGQDEPQA